MYGCTPNGRAWEGSAGNRGVVVATTEVEWMTFSSEDAQTEPASVTPTVTGAFCENEEGEKLFRHAVEWLFWLRLGWYIQFNFTYTELVHHNSSLKVLYILTKHLALVWRKKSLLRPAPGSGRGTAIRGEGKQKKNTWLWAEKNGPGREVTLWKVKMMGQGHLVCSNCKMLCTKHLFL